MSFFLRVSTEMNGEKSIRIQISAVSCRAHGNELSIVLYGSRTSQSEERDGPGAFGWRFLTLCSIRGSFSFISHFCFKDSGQVQTAGGSRGWISCAFCVPERGELRFVKIQDFFYQEEKVDKSRESRHCRKLVRLPPTSTYGNCWNGACPASNFNVRFRFKGHVVPLPYGRLEVRTRPEPILVWISTYTHAHGVVPITLRRSHPPGQEKRVESFSDFPPSRVRSPSSPNLRDVVFASGVCVCLIMWRKGWGECCSHFVGHLLIASAAIVVSTITSTITISSSRLDLDNSREYRKCGLRFPSAMRYYDFGYGVILILGQECWGLKDV